MTNIYKYSKDIIKEYQTAWWNNEFKIGNITMAFTFIFSIMVLIYNIKNTDTFSFSSLLILLPILYYPTFFIKRNKSIKNELKKYLKLEENTIKTTLKDNIKIELNKKEIEVSYDKIKKYIETDNLIIIFMKNNGTISLKKDSFIDGTVEECKKLLNEKIKQKRTRKRKNNIKKGER